MNRPDLTDCTRRAGRLLALVSALLAAGTHVSAQDAPTAGQNQSAASPEAVALPQVQAGVHGLGDAPSASLTTGGASYVVPFALPPGRGTVTAQLSLTYASGAGQGVAGMGFSLSVPSIARDTERGVPGYVDGKAYHPQEDRFAYDGHDLVPVDSTAVAALDGAPVPPELRGYQQYRARIEGKFMRFFRAPDGLRWVVQSPQGMLYEFGAIESGPAELTAPGLFSGSALAGDDVTGSGAALSAHRGRVFRWWLTRVSDTHGSTIYYRYTQSEGSVYLSDVYYLSPQTCVGTPASARLCTAPLASYGARAHLVYEPRPDPVTSYRSGERVRLALRLRRVELTAAAEQAGQRFLVRRYHLGYDLKSYHSLLRSVQLEGRPEADDASVRSRVGNARVPESVLGDELVGVLFPPLGFGYTGDERLLAGAFGFPALDATLRKGTTSPNVGVQDPRADLFDVNRDGLPDLVVTDPTTYRTPEGGPAIGVYFNGFAGTAATPGAPGAFSEPVPTAVRAEDALTLRFNNPNLRAFEVDGDGGSEFLHMPKRAQYDYFVVSREPESGSPRPSEHGYRWLHVPVALPQGGIDAAIDLTDAKNIRMLDVNGDGLVDLLRSTSTRLEAYLNLGYYPGGDGRFGSASFANGSFQLSTAPVVHCLPATPGAPLTLADAGVLVADMNGDGLSDLARLTSSRLIYWPSRGNGYFGTGDSSCASGFQGDIHVEVQTPPRYPVGVERKLVLTDMEGDGLPDLLFLGDGTASIWFNRGGESFTERIVLRGLPRWRNVEEFVRTLDIDGSGTNDIVFARSGEWRWIDPAGGMRPRLLQSVTNGLGAQVSIEYQSSSSDYLRDLAAADACHDGSCETFAWSHVDDGCDARIASLTGECARKPAGSPVLPTVVRAITTHDGFERLGLTPAVTRLEYAYHDPYYEGIERAFRGFVVADMKAVGDTLHPGSTQRTHTFVAARPRSLASSRLAENPYDALQGLTYLVESFAADGTYLATRHAGYVVRTLLSGLDGRSIVFAYSRRDDDIRYDVTGFTPAAPGRTLDDPLEGGSGLEAVRFERVVGSTPIADPAHASERHAVRLRSERYAHMVSRSDDVDNVGHSRTHIAYGRIRGEFGESFADPTIITRAEWALQGPAHAWQFRPVRSYIEDARSRARYRQVEQEYDAEGDLRLTRSILDAASPYEFAGDNDGALGFVPQREHPVSSTMDDGWGQLTASCDGADMRNGDTSNCLRYSEIGYDGAYGQLPLTKSVALARTGSDFAFANTAVLAYDRAFSMATRVRDANGSVSEAGADGLGRPTWFRTPGAGACAGTSIPNVRVRYALTSDPQQNPLSFVETLEERACAFGEDTLVKRTYSDGLGRARAALVSAEAPHLWQRSDQVTFDAQGAILRAYQPDFLDIAEPTLSEVVALPSTPSVQSSYDAFGRARCTRQADGLGLTCVSYHALSQDLCDPNDHDEASPAYRTCTTTRSDGHGRAVDTILRNVQPSGQAEVYRLFTDFRADGAAERITRAQTVSDAPREQSQIVQGRFVSRTFSYDSLGRLLASSDRDTDARRSGAGAYNSTYRYLYNRIGNLVATRDPRGCGVNSFRDMGGRVLGEQYVGCAGVDTGEAASEMLAAGTIALGVLDDAVSVDTRSYFDAYPAWATGELTPPADGAATLGRLTAVSDRAQRSVFSYDLRGNLTWTGRQMAVVPAATAEGSSGASGTPAVRYDTLHTYVFEAEHDFANRARAAHFPENFDYAGPGARPSISGEVLYNRRGLARATSVSIGGVPYSVIADATYAADGLTERVVYGDGALGRAPTVFSASYDVLRRPLRVDVRRSPTALASGERTLAEVSTVFDQEYLWDAAGNLLEQRDLRPAQEHPDGYRPQSVSIARDALYRVTEVAYTYQRDEGGTTADPARDWRDVARALSEVDPMGEVPPESIAALPPERVVSMTWTQDWLGNTVDWDDDASAFHERSLGTLSHGIDEPGGRPSALRFASNLPHKAPAPAAFERGGYLEVSYGEGGNVESVTVHGQCRDAQAEQCWDDAGLPLAERAQKLATRCTCQEEQRFEYRWDELNRIGDARRYDRKAGAWELAARLGYRYDAKNQRLVKQVIDHGDERFALYVYPGDFERRGLTRGLDHSYEASPEQSESQYLASGARVVWSQPPSSQLLAADHRITVNVGDLLGTTGAVIDLYSGELLELSTYYANGARESLRTTERAQLPLEPSGFTAKEADEEVGLTYFGERYLMPHLGRWASPDPLQVHAAGGGEPLNNYHYISAHLLQARDPIGLEEGDPYAQAFDIAYPKDDNGSRWDVDIKGNVWVLEDGASDWRLLTPLSEATVVQDTRVSYAKRRAWSWKGCMETDACRRSMPYEGGQVAAAAHALAYGYDQGWITLEEVASENSELAELLHERTKRAQAREDISKEMNFINGFERIKSHTSLGFIQMPLLGAMGGMPGAFGNAYDLTTTGIACANGDPVGCGLGLGGRAYGHWSESPTGGCPECPCFVPGTLILMADGSAKPIEDVEVDDMVLGADPEHAGMVEPHRVLHTMENLTQRVVRIELGSETSPEVIRATGEHPFWTLERGWVAAHSLGAGDSLLGPDGELVEVVSMAEQSESSPTHNLTVEGVHAYFVAAGGHAVLVHNQNIPLGEGYAGRIDAFNTKGVASFEVHVYDPDGVEVGVHGPRDWIPKHGHSGAAPALPQVTESVLNGVVIDENRARGYLPEKGAANIKGGRWKGLVSPLCP